MKLRGWLRAAALTLALFVALVPQLQAAGGKMYGYIDEETGRAFVPIRFFSEQAGASVDWDAANKRVTIGLEKDEVRLYVGRSTAFKNGEPIELSDVPFAAGGATYVPLRFVTDALGLNAEWDASLAAVKLQLADGTVKLPVVARGAQAAGKPPFARSTRSFRVGGRTIKAELLTVNLLHPGVKLSVGLAGGKVGATDELKRIAEQAGAKAAMNGTFFDAYTESAVKVPYGYIVSGGELVREAPGDKRTVLLFDEAGNVELVDGADFVERFGQGDVAGALQAGPRLVRDSKVDVRVQDEGFRDPKILTGGGARSAIGVTRDHRLILATAPGATNPQMAEIMKQAGAAQAMNMDGGASSGLYYNGEYVTKPGRPISNALVISGP